MSEACPNCGGKISDSGISCPSCGRLLSGALAKTWLSIQLRLLAWGAIVTVTVVIFMLIFNWATDP